MAELERILLTEMLQWYRLQRHDIMNHWQVIMGYLQLNQPEKALEYMRETAVVSGEEQKISLLPEPRLAGILLGFILRLRGLGVTASLDYPEEMKKDDFWQVHWREEYGEALYGYTKEGLEFVSETLGANKSDSPGTGGVINSLSAEVYLFEEPKGFSCQLILEDEETVYLDKTINIEVS